MFSKIRISHFKRDMTSWYLYAITCCTDLYLSIQNRYPCPEWDSNPRF